MKLFSQKILYTALGMALTLPSVGYSAVPFSDRPLFISGSAKPNLVFTLDDSGSMDHETLFPTLDGSLFFRNGWATDSNGDYWGTRNSYYMEAPYVFPVARSSTYNGGRLFSDAVVAPVRAYAFARSPDFNPNYYDYRVEYSPWPSNSAVTYADSTPSAAKFDPNYSSYTKNLTSSLTETFSGFGGYTYFPATFYVVKPKGTFSAGGTVYDCESTNPSTYRLIYSSDKNRSVTSSSGVDALAPDGSCLQRVEIKSGNQSLISSLSGRTYAEEIQNFANWFTYYRRRHQSLRGAVSESLDSLSGVRLGLVWINNLASISMRDIDSQKNAFINEVYSHFNGWSGGGTPLRGALKYTGTQFDTNTSIIEAECQKNFTLLFTDGFNNQSVSGIDNADKDEGQPYADKFENTLADIAMSYYKDPLRGSAFARGKVRLPAACYKKEGDPGYSSLTPKLVEPTDPSYDQSADCNSNLHLNTYTVGFGSVGEHYAGIGYDSVADVYANYPDWNVLSPSSQDGNQIDDLLHAAVNGRGEFYNATSVEKLRTSVSAAIRDIILSTGSATNVTFNTATLEQGSEVYTASFNSGDWSGSVAARALNPVTGGIGSTLWDAADTLNAATPANRFIVTYNSGGVPFTWSQLSSDQQDDLNGPSNDSLGPDRLAYLRGDRSKETTTFRKRSTVLGDVVNSSPVYVGAPASGLPDRDPFGAATTGRYSTFKQDKANRTPVVYAGANDGMLHGFNAKTGEELVAYIPSFVYSTSAKSGLNYLSDPGYEHRFYVDLSPAVADAYIGDASGTGAAWKTVLIGGLRSGGRGLFALDVTDPSQFDGSATAAESLVLWEFSHPDLGYITEPPLIALVEWGNNDYRWSALVPNGYNSDNGKTGLFVLDIEAGQDGWDASDYKFIELQQSGSGLSPLRAVDYKDTSGVAVRDGIVDRVYAGDLNGNVWAVDLSGGSFASVYSSGNSKNAPAEPLFVAKDASGNLQPITTAPVMGRNIYNTQGSSPNLFVFFGTGRYLTTSDPNSTATQSFYGVWDQGSKVTRDQLASRSITKSTKSGREVRTVGGSGIDWTDTSANAKRGWYVDFTPEPGERVIESPLVRGEYVLFNTITPSQSLCQSGGTSWTMALRFDGTTPQQPVFDVNNDGKVDSNDAIVGGVRYGDAMILNSNILGDNLYRQASDGKVDQTKVDLGGGKTLGRSGWREIYEE